MNSLILKAYAKINLGLHVKFRRPDGFHEIETILQEINLCDIIKIMRSERNVFTCDNQVLCAEDSNLCTQAADLLCAEFGLPGFKIELKKRIPIGAGLGGGSSDAAAVIRGGLLLYDLSPPQREVHNLCAQLGSDVPFFINGKSAYATGRGEKLIPVSISTDYKILLLLPDIHISTEWAYKNLKLGLTQQWADNKFRSSEFHELKVSDFNSEFFNSFEPLVFKKYPVLEEMKRVLVQNGALFAGMSGSGSTIFGLFDPDFDLSELIGDLQTIYNCKIAIPVR